MGLMRPLTFFEFKPKVISLEHSRRSYLTYLAKLKELMTEEEFRDRDIWADLDADIPHLPDER